jgi:hypothetical protein
VTAVEEGAPSPIEALTTAVMGLEGSRRVGWAKAFEAIRQLETASHDLSVAREDRHIYRQRLSYLYGFFGRFTDPLGQAGTAARTEIARVTNLDDAPLDSVEVRHGREHAERVIAAAAQTEEADRWDSAKRDAERRRLRKQARREIREASEDVSASDRMFAAAKRKAIAELAAEYGLEGEAQLRERLEAAR